MTGSIIGARLRLHIVVAAAGDNHQLGPARLPAHDGLCAGNPYPSADGRRVAASIRNGLGRAEGDDPSRWDFRCGCEYKQRHLGIERAGSVLGARSLALAEGLCARHDAVVRDRVLGLVNVGLKLASYGCKPLMQFIFHREKGGSPARAGLLVKSPAIAYIHGPM
jgi:hypothetical protein